MVAGAWCANRTVDATTKHVNQCDICFNSMILARYISSFVSFFLVFPIKGLSLIFDIQIYLKLKHP